MSGWWHAAAGSLLGTGAGVRRNDARDRTPRQERRERRAMAEALAAIQTELLVAANHLLSSVSSAQRVITSGQIPAEPDDLSLMYRTHASVVHSQLPAMDVFRVTVAYSYLMRYSRGGYIADAPSRFVEVFGLYLSTVHAVYNAYMRLGAILEARYGLPIIPELSLFSFIADMIARSCEHELAARPGAATGDERHPEIRNIKARADWLKADLGKNGSRQHLSAHRRHPARKRHSKSAPAITRRAE